MTHNYADIVMMPSRASLITKGLRPAIPTVPCPCTLPAHEASNRGTAIASKGQAKGRTQQRRQGRVQAGGQGAAGAGRK